MTEKILPILRFYNHRRIWFKRFILANKFQKVKNGAFEIRSQNRYHHVSRALKKPRRLSEARRCVVTTCGYTSRKPPAQRISTQHLCEPVLLFTPRFRFPTPVLDGFKKQSTHSPFYVTAIPDKYSLL